MRIIKFCIKNFRSILDSGEVALDPKITILIGKNESGKTNILKALESFRTDYEYAKTDLCLHSNAREKLELKKIKEGDIEIITIWFEIEEEDKRKLKEINSQLIKMKTLKVTKYFDNTYQYDSPEISLEDKKIDVKKKFEKNLSEIKSIATAFKGKLDNHCQRYAPFSDSKAQYDEIINEIISFNPEASPEIESVFHNFSRRILDLPNQDESILNDVEAFFREIDPHKKKIKEIFSKKEMDLINDVLKIMPNFLYFTGVERLDDGVPISEFLANKRKYKTLFNLIKLSGLDVERAKDALPYDMLSELGDASTSVTGMVNQCWSQEKLKLNIRIVRDEIFISIFDDVIKKEHPPSIRSQGFQWFLSFYINFMAGSKGEFKNTIILLDDLGIYLHSSGQRDLLDTLEKISESNQFVCSTHSPFMIDREKLHRIKSVSKKARKGTIIEEKYRKSDYEVFEPIRLSKGMKIGDSLFPTKKNLLVEGYSDELILEAMSNLCLKKEVNNIDTSKVSIFPVNGPDKMPFFATICKQENLDFVVLLDFDTKGKNAAKRLKEKFKINEDQIIMLDKLGGEFFDLETEDLIDIDFYLEALNRVYGENFREKLDKRSIIKDDLKDKTFKGIKEFFKEKKIGTAGRVDRIKIAKRIKDLIALDKTPDDKTLSRFSLLFRMINERLKV